MFGFGRKKQVEAPAAPSLQARVALTDEELFEKVVRFYVENRLVASSLHSVQVDTKVVVGSKNQVTKVARFFDGYGRTYLEKALETGERFVKRQNLVNRIANEIHDEQSEIVRSRAMVKAFRAGLTESDVYLKIVEEKDIRELAKLERWVDNSNAYQAYLDTVN